MHGLQFLMENAADHIWSIIWNIRQGKTICYKHVVIKIRNILHNLVCIFHTGNRIKSMFYISTDKKWRPFDPIMSFDIRSHYNDVIMTSMASQITSLTIVYSTVYSGSDQRKLQSSASLARAGHSPVTGEFLAHRASKAENISIWWRHHGHLNFGMSTILTIYFRFWTCVFLCFRLKLTTL